MISEFGIFLFDKLIRILITLFLLLVVKFHFATQFNIFLVVNKNEQRQKEETR